MLAVIVRNFVKEENEAAFLKAAMAHREATRTLDAGCVAFEVSVPESGEITFVELWDTKDNLDAHSRAGEGRGHLAIMNSLRYAKDLEILPLL